MRGSQSVRMEVEKADLVRRLIADDPSALEEAYRLYAARCNGIAYRILQDDSAAQDAVQEGFLILWRHRHGLVVRTAGVGPWLSVVVRNAAIGMLRRGTSRDAREERVHTINPAPIAQDPADTLAASADASRLRAAMQRLPAEQRRVLELSYFHYLTMAQISERTDTPLGTVKRRAQVALRQLGRLMSEQTS